MLGEVLRKAREEQNLTIEDLERETSIRKAYIAAIEEENFDALPSDVYIKGFIRNLSRFLHTDGDALISEFIDLRKAKISEEKGEVSAHDEFNNSNNAIGNIKSENITVSLEQKRNDKAKKSNFFVTVVLILALIGAGAFYFMNKSDENALTANNSASTDKLSDAKEKKTEEPKKVEKKAETPATVDPKKAEQETKVAAPTQNAAAPQNATPPTNAANAPIEGVEVVAGIDGAAWIRVIVDGNVVFEDIAADGSVHTWKGKDSIVIRAGNAGAVKITHNGKDEGAMGERGQIAEKAYKR